MDHLVEVGRKGEVSDSQLQVFVAKMQVEREEDGVLVSKRETYFIVDPDLVPLNEQVAFFAGNHEFNLVSCLFTTKFKTIRLSKTRILNSSLNKKAWVTVDLYRSRNSQRTSR
jgi:hypothetical protein